jgi:hypothetical protein
LDGTDVVQTTKTNLRLDSIEEYVQSPEDSRVAMVVTKYLAAISDEEMAKEMDTGNVTTMVQMLQSQSNLMKELESKLAGVTAISWEEVRDRQLAQLRREIQENEALLSVSQLIDLTQGLGQTDRLLKLTSQIEGGQGIGGMAQKMNMQRNVRNLQWNTRGGMDDYAPTNLLEEALKLTDALIGDFPDLQEELTNIRERLNEQLANFS